MDDILLLLFAERMLNCQIIIKPNNGTDERGNRMVVSIGKERKV